MNDIPLGVLLGQVEEVDSACSLVYVNDDIEDLFEAVGAFVNSHQIEIAEAACVQTLRGDTCEGNGVLVLLYFKNGW